MMYKLTILFLLILNFNSVLADDQVSSVSQYPIQKFKGKSVKLWEYPDAKDSLRIDPKLLGEPEQIAVLGFAGGSNEHLVISYQGKKYSFSRSKVVLDSGFDERTATGKRCTQSNLGKNESRAETTSVCER